MGIFDKAKDMLGEHLDKVDQGVEHAGDLIDERTGGQYAEHVDQGQSTAKERLSDYLAGDQAQPPVTGEPDRPGPA